MKMSDILPKFINYKNNRQFYRKLSYAKHGDQVNKKKLCILRLQLPYFEYISKFYEFYFQVLLLGIFKIIVCRFEVTILFNFFT